MLPIWTIRTEIKDIATGAILESSKRVKGIPSQNPIRKMRPDTNIMEQIALVLLATTSPIAYTTAITRIAVNELIVEPP